MTVSYQCVLVDEDRGVGVVTLNRPERMNAFTERLGLELRHAIAAFDVRDDIRAIVVTGAGRAFCAGADLEAGGDTFRGGASEERRHLARALAPATDREPWEMHTPIIAAINGAAVGVGLTLTMQWDMRIAAEDAKLGFAFNRRGVIPELGSQWLVPRLVGVSRGLELLLTGKLVRGREAAEMGLVSSAVPATDVLPTALALAHDIATNVAPVSAAIVKRLVYRFLEETDRKGAQRLEGKLFAWTATQDDAKEGPVAFLEKREPDWKLAKYADFPDEVFES